MAKHLLKLNDIEDQFRDLTNRFEEVNFKLDKLSNRITKIQSDSQLRFNDLESGIISKNPDNKIIKKLSLIFQKIIVGIYLIDTLQIGDSLIRIGKREQKNL